MSRDTPPPPPQKTTRNTACSLQILADVNLSVQAHGAFAFISAHGEDLRVELLAPISGYSVFTG
jgi:hypothetical protein